MKQLFVISLALWAGMILGLSFIATSAKFLAPNLSLPVALEVGKVTFQLFNKIEWAMLLITVILGCYSKVSNIKTIILASLLAILLLQTFYLFPALNIGTDNIIAGKEASKTSHHLIYVVCEITKLIIALFGSIYIAYERKNK